MDDFTIELVSSASSEIHPENHASLFTNVFPEQINLSAGDWEVGLLEVAHPTAYYNVTDGHFSYSFKDADDNDRLVTKNFYLPKGIYQSVNDVMAGMRSLLSTVHITLEWDVGYRTRSVTVELKNSKGYLKWESADLPYILGFQVGYYLHGQGPFFTLYPFDIVRIHSMMIYTNGVTNVIVGDTRAPLLRSIPFITKLKNEEILSTQCMNHVSLNLPQYRKVQKHSFNSMRIEIRSNTGEIIPFIPSIGYTRLTLHFRRRLQAVGSSFN